MLWLLLYIGGEPLLERAINSLKHTVNESMTITEQAKTLILQVLKFIKEQKETFIRIHHALFYIDGRYYNISNRITGIKYVIKKIQIF